MNTYILSVEYRGHLRRGVSVGNTLEAAKDAFLRQWPGSIIKLARLATPVEEKNCNEKWDPSFLYAG